MIARILLVAAAAAAARAPGALAQTRIEAQIFFGSSESLSLPITIEQAGQPDLHFSANWSTRPATPTWYYAWRIGLWKGDRGWRLDHTHHKLYLDNPPPEVQALRITNGFNILTISRAFRDGRLTYSIGAGPVITYPISTVRGKRFGHDNGFGGYHVSGGSLMAMATREFPLVNRLVAMLDARASASYVRIPIADGHANVPNVAFHLQAGLGYSFGGGD